MNDHREGRVHLGALYADRLPPPDLEERVVADWASAVGARPDVPRRARTWTYRMAAGVVLFLAGWGSARLSGDDGVGARPRAEHMLLLWEDAAFGEGEEPGALAEEYAAWAGSVAAAGIGITGEELGPSRSWVSGDDVADTRPSPGDLRLGGYFLVDIPDRDAARRLAESHPHVGHGGWVEVAPIVRR
jgi:hypothetical protein